MASGDVYKLDLRGLWAATIPWQSRFTYQLVNAVSGVAERCFEGFEEDVLPELIACAPTAVTFEQIDVVCVRTPTDFYSEALGSEPGTRITDPVSQLAPSFLAVQYRSNRAGPGTRHGRKRFPFLYEADFSGNDLASGVESDPDFLAVATVLGQAISFASISFTPVICHGALVLGVVPTVSFPVESYGLRTRISTQNSRKPASA